MILDMGTSLCLLEVNIVVNLFEYLCSETPAKCFLDDLVEIDGCWSFVCHIPFNSIIIHEFLGTLTLT